jgi:preprotein translocase subunit SecD
MPNIEQQEQTILVGFFFLLLFNIWYYSWFLFVAAVLYLAL